MAQDKVLIRRSGHEVLDELDATDIPDLSGTYQPLDADLTAIAGLTSAANKGIQFTGSGTAGTYDLTTAGKALLDDAAASDQRTTLGLGTAATHATGDYDAAGAAATSTSTAASALSSHEADTTSIHGIANTANLYVAGGTDVAVADGGTGGSDAATARTNLGLLDVPWTLVTKASDESLNTNTTLQNDDELLFATVAGGIYEFDCFLLYGSPVGAGTPDLKFAAGEDNTSRGNMFVVGLSTTDTNNITSGAVRQGTALTTFGTAAANRLARIHGEFLAVGGTFSIQWAQGTSDANNVTVRATSFMRYRRLA